MRITKLFSAFLCFMFLLGALPSCAPSNIDSKPENEVKTQGKSYYDYFDTMSAVFSYKGDSADEFSANCEAVSALLKEYHQLFDIYYEYADVNNLKTVNKNAGVAPVKVDSKLIDGLVGGQLVSSLLAVSCITVAFCSNFLMVQDKANGTYKDLNMSPVKPGALAISYYAATLISTLIVCYFAVALSFVFLAFTKVIQFLKMQRKTAVK